MQIPYVLKAILGYFQELFGADSRGRRGRRGQSMPNRPEVTPVKRLLTERIHATPKCCTCQAFAGRDNPCHSRMLTRCQRFGAFLTKTERGNEKSCISPLFLKQNSLHARDLYFWFFPGREFSFDFLWFLQHFPSARRRTWDFPEMLL